MQTAAALQKREKQKTTDSAASVVQKKSVLEPEEHPEKSGVPLFLQHSILCNLGVKANSPLQKHTPVIQKPVESQSPHSPLVNIQRSLGNYAYGRMIQAKLKISEPGDIYEQEADRVADQVMGLPEPALQHQMDSKKEENLITTKPLADKVKRFTGNSSPELSDEFESKLGSLRGRGSAIPDSLRSYMEPRYRADFSDIRVHNNSESAGLARSVNAQASTIQGRMHNLQERLRRRVNHQNRNIRQRAAQIKRQLRRSIDRGQERIEHIISEGEKALEKLDQLVEHGKRAVMGCLLDGSGDIARISFDGNRVELQCSETKSFAARSGLMPHNPNNTENIDYTHPQYQHLPNKGPIPEGGYVIDPSEVDNNPPGSAWGGHRVPLHECFSTEFNRRIKTDRTGGFYLHGDGGNNGTAGCIGIIDLNENAKVHELIEINDAIIPVKVEYPEQSNIQNSVTNTLSRSSNATIFSDVSRDQSIQCIPSGENRLTPDSICCFPKKQNEIGLPELNRKFESKLGSLRGRGSALPDSLRSHMEARFGADFSDVRVHNNSDSSGLARSVNAQAFTVGKDIVFGGGYYAPETEVGKRLVAHELAHVVQQGAEIVVRRVDTTQTNNSLDNLTIAEVDTASLKVDTASPETDTASPETDTAPPETDTAPPETDTAPPETDTAPPETIIESDDENIILDIDDKTPSFYSIGLRNNRGGNVPVYDIEEPGSWRIRSSAIINNNFALIRNPENLSEFLTCSADCETPAGLHKVRRRFRIPNNSSVIILEEESVRRQRFVLVDWGEGQGWTLKSNIKIDEFTLKTGTRISVVNVSDDYQMKYVRWDNGEGWIRSENAIETRFDLTYATRFASSEKHDLAWNVPKDTQVRYEQDGISAKDTFMDIPSITRTGRGIIGHLGSFTAFNVDNGEVLHESEGEGYNIVGPVIIIKQGISIEGKGLFVRVMSFESDREFLVRQRMINYQGEYGYGLEQDYIDGLYLVMRRSSEEKESRRYKITDKAAQILQERYMQNVRNLLESRTYTQNQKNLLEEAEHFAETKQDQNTGIPDLPIADHIIVGREGDQPEAGERLNQDLIDRIQRYYKFLRYKKLIEGNVIVTSGIRTRARAHELSTKWTLNPRSGLLRSRDNKVEFVRRLTLLNGWHDSAHILWTDGNEAQEIELAIYYIWHPTYFIQNIEHLQLPHGINPNNNLKKLFEEILLVKRDFFKASENLTCAPDVAPDQIVEFGLLVVEAYTNLCRSRVTSVGNRSHQRYQAAEGFSRLTEIFGKRLPNTNDTMGISNHCGGEAMDIHFPFVFNYYDPIIDAIALIFGLHRPVKDSRGSPEHFHYERVGISRGEQYIQEPNEID